MDMYVVPFHRLSLEHSGHYTSASVVEQRTGSVRHNQTDHQITPYCNRAPESLNLSQPTSMSMQDYSVVPELVLCGESGSRGWRHDLEWSSNAVADGTCPELPAQAHISGG